MSEEVLPRGSQPSSSVPGVSEGEGSSHADSELHAPSAAPTYHLPLQTGSEGVPDFRDEILILDTEEIPDGSFSPILNGTETEQSQLSQQVIERLIRLRNDDVQHEIAPPSNSDAVDVPPAPEIPQGPLDLVSLVINKQVTESGKKRPRSDNEASPKKIAKFKEDSDNDGATCTICLENWSSSGEHRLASLKCGHVFGHSCILQWLSDRSHKNCPSCKAKAVKKDIRFIYASKLMACDTDELQFYKAELEKERRVVSELRRDFNDSTLKLSMYQIRINELERTVARLKTEPVRPAPTVRNNWRFSLETNLEIVKNYTCRVLSFNSRTDRMYVSHESTTPLFAGYGLRVVDIHHKNLERHITCHSKAIRDLNYSDRNNLLISVSLDKFVKLIHNEGTTVSIQTPHQLWSCCWDREESTRFYVGTNNGIVQQYDIRQTSCSVYDIKCEEKTPVVSVVSVPRGLLCCQLNTLSAHRKEMIEFVGTQLPIEGSFTCASYDPDEDKILVSCRPSGQYKFARHNVCSLSIERNFEFNVEQAYVGSSSQSTMTRSTFIHSPEDEASWVAAANEADKMINIWDVGTQKLVHNLGINDNIMDMSNIYFGNRLHLVTLSQSRLRLYAMINSDE